MKRMKLYELVKSGTDILQNNSIDNASYDAFILLSNVMNIDKTYYLTHLNEEVSQDKVRKYLFDIELRRQRIPLQHIIGYADFYGYRFKVNENVLIPRQDTEVLVEQVLKCAGSNSAILDMCTGSGCIALTVGLKAGAKCVTGVDISSAALEVAISNKISLNADNVTFVKSDLFENLKSAENTEYDIIVSNPPYIETQVIETLTDEVRLHDPRLALDGLADGLHFYRQITGEAYKYLRKGGWLMYEIGYEQSEAVKYLMEAAGYTDITVIKDLAGLDRVVKGRLL